jgi:hypothetical protein
MKFAVSGNFRLSKYESEEDDQQVMVEYFFGFLRLYVMLEEAMEVNI